MEPREVRQPGARRDFVSGLQHSGLVVMANPGRCPGLVCGRAFGPKRVDAGISLLPFSSFDRYDGFW